MRNKIAHGYQIPCAPSEDALAGGAAGVQHAMQQDPVAHQRVLEVPRQRQEVHVNACDSDATLRNEGWDHRKKPLQLPVKRKLQGRTLRMIFASAVLSETMPPTWECFREVHALSRKGQEQ